MTGYIKYVKEDSGRIVYLDETSGRAIQLQPNEVLEIGKDVTEEFAAAHTEIKNCIYCDKDGNVQDFKQEIATSKPIDNVIPAATPVSPVIPKSVDTANVSA